jgi:hypothetical protein
VITAITNTADAKPRKPRGWIFDWFARNRSCGGGAGRVDLEVPGGVGFLDWAGAMLVPALVAFACRRQPAWLYMWALVFGLGIALKWLTWRDATAHGARPSAKQAFAWFALWPGLDGRAFLAEHVPVKRPELREWLWTAAVISLPARGGFGLPTLYFVLQGAGVALERSRVGRNRGLGKGIQGWLFVVLFTIGPLYWLFHPAFARRVIAPFLSAVNHS